MTASTEERAVRAWRQLRPATSDRISFVGLAHKKGSKRRDRSPYVIRLVGAGPGGSNVIAKLCPTSSVEGVIYESVLPRLTVSKLEFYGKVPDAQTGRLWIFLEDIAADRQVSFQTDRNFVADWLAAVHVTEAADWPRLPQRDGHEYFTALHEAVSLIDEVFSAGSVPGREALTSLRLLLEDVVAAWSRIGARMANWPTGLVHGDMVPKNLRVRGSSGTGRLIAFDWEHAGWGLTAIDLGTARIHRKADSLAIYTARVAERWPGIDAAAVRGLGEMGALFRAILSIRWALQELAASPPDGPVELLELYAGALREALARIDPSDSS